MNNTNLNVPDEGKRYALATIYTSLALLAAFSILLFLEPAHTKVAHHPNPTYLLIETIKQLRNTNQIIIIPLTIFSGLEQAFLFGDYSQASFLVCLQ